MANTEILLIKPVDGLGGEGEQVKVKAGYARNYLLPRNYAVPVNRANRKQIEALQKARLARESKELEGAQAIANKLATVTIAIAVKTGEGGKMFGSVTAQNLVDRLAEEGIPVEKKQFNLTNPVKELGKHEVEIKLHSKIKVNFSFEVVSENIIPEAAENK